MRRPVLQAALTLLTCAAVLGGLIAAGQALRERLRASGRLQFPFRDIACPVPPDMERTAFLGEVQYLSEFPDDVPLLDAELPGRLAAAFARHPWVEHVDKVVIGPGRIITVSLSFRTPVLTVRYASGARSGEPLTLRAVDGQGVLLPPRHSREDLPELKTPVPAPAGSAGQPWGHKLVEQAAALAAFLRARQRELKLAQFDFANGEFRLSTESGATVLWGRPPGEEADGEPAAEAKLQQLLDYYDKHGGLDRPRTQLVHDVRKAAK